MPRGRTIGGKRYRHGSYHGTKRLATKRAKSLRSRGTSARVLPAPKGGYNIWVGM